MNLRTWIGCGLLLTVFGACSGTSPLSDSVRGEDAGAPEGGSQPSAAGSPSVTPGAGRDASQPAPAAGSGSGTAGRSTAAGSGAAGTASAAGSGGSAAAEDACPPGFTAPPVCEPCSNRTCAVPACRNGSFSHWKCPPAMSSCVVGGCSGQLCADGKDEPLVSTCEFREEYACYRTATCERQASGQCAWTQTPALQKCLANPSAADAGT